MLLAIPPLPTQDETIQAVAVAGLILLVAFAPFLLFLGYCAFLGARDFIRWIRFGG